MAEFVYGITDELHRLGLQMIQESLESMDEMLRESPIRKKIWHIETRTSKQLITSLGEVTFQKTLFTNKETGVSTYLLDRILGLKMHERLTEDAEARIMEVAVQTSYRRGGRNASLTADVSKQTVMNKLYQLQFPEETVYPQEKKVVEYLYVEADEDHVSRQFREKKGDLQETENHQKNNTLISKLVYVHEGLEPDKISGQVMIIHLMNPSGFEYRTMSLVYQM